MLRMNPSMPLNLCRVSQTSALAQGRFNLLDFKTAPERHAQGWCAHVSRSSASTSKVLGSLPSPGMASYGPWAMIQLVGFFRGPSTEGVAFGLAGEQREKSLRHFSSIKHSIMGFLELLVAFLSDCGNASSDSVRMNGFRELDKPIVRRWKSEEPLEVNSVYFSFGKIGLRRRPSGLTPNGRRAQSSGFEAE
nr:hypothetical protein Iba_chr01dCG3440 [Ipomoea batatas]